MPRFALAGLLIFFVGFVRADDFDERKLTNWHQWRGPLATGEAPAADPPVRWSVEKNIRWKADLPGKGSATPVVWNDRVFVVTAVATDKKVDPENRPSVDPRFEKKTVAPQSIHQFIVLCFDRASGKKLWSKLATEQVPHEGTHPTHSYAAGSPTTDGHFLYVSFGSFGIYCFDFEGNLQWQRDLGRLNTRLGWGEAVTPVWHDGSLVLNWDQEADSALVCLDARTGKTRWTTPRDEKTSWNTPFIANQGGTAQVIVNGTNRMRAYNLADGQVIWECPGMTVNAIPSPVARDGVAYLVSGYRGAAAAAISLAAKGDQKDDANVLWRYGKGTPYVPSPLLLKDRLWFTQANSQVLTILDTKTGKPVLEQERLPKVNSFYGSPAAAGGRVYLTDRDGVTAVLKADDSAEVLAVNKLDDAVDASPAVAGKQLFLRGQKHLYCIEEQP